jgi:hypothetical protein
VDKRRDALFSISLHLRVDQGAEFLDDLGLLGGEVSGFAVVAGMVVELVSGFAALGFVAD